jgi:hypothetical protein
MIEFLRLEEFRLPARYYAGTSPYIDQIQSDYFQWCDDMTNLTQEGRTRYRKQNLVYAAARSFPAPGSYVRAKACALQLFWTTLFDDFYGHLPTRDLVVLRERIIALLLGDDLHPMDPPLLSKVKEFRDLYVGLVSEQWITRYVQTIDDYFRMGVERETRAREEKRPLTLNETNEIRPYSTIMIPYLRTIEIELDISIPDHVASHPIMRRIDHLAARIATWQNDAFSLLKEVTRPEKEAETCNLVFTLQHEFDLTFSEACNELLRIFKADVAEFDALACTLPNFDKHQKCAETAALHAGTALTGLERFYRQDTSRYVVDGDWAADDEHLTPYTGKG